METATYINLASTALLMLAMYKQVLILVYMKREETRFVKATKIMFPIFNVCIQFGMWGPFFGHRISSAIFFLIAALIVVRVYFFPPDNQN